MQWKGGRLTDILRRNCLLKHVTEWNREGTERRGRRRKQLLDDYKEKKRKIMDIVKRSSRSYCLENSLWKSLWTFPKPYYGMNEWMNGGEDLPSVGLAIYLKFILYINLNEMCFSHQRNVSVQSSHISSHLIRILSSQFFLYAVPQPSCKLQHSIPCTIKCTVCYTNEIHILN